MTVETKPTRKPRSTKKGLWEFRGWTKGRISTANEDEGRGSLKSKDGETGTLKAQLGNTEYAKLLEEWGRSQQAIKLGKEGLDWSVRALTGRQWERLQVGEHLEVMIHEDQLEKC